jgi:hypothetical protein
MRSCAAAFDGGIDDLAVGIPDENHELFTTVPAGAAVEVRWDAFGRGI